MNTVSVTIILQERGGEGREITSAHTGAEDEKQWTLPPVATDYSSNQHAFTGQTMRIAQLTTAESGPLQSPH